MKQIRIFFDEAKAFRMTNIKLLAGITGLYFIFLKQTAISYPFKPSRLIYIGMSEKRTNSIGKRLADHFEGNSRNPGLVNYRKVEDLLFTSLNFETLRQKWELRIEDLETYYIRDFVRQYGVYPICNNKTSWRDYKAAVEVELEIDWKYFAAPG
ncbi:MAG: GIY-YIG nuclease family protein [bacterium]|nr:GIY-YIG nuclease family protein [bacterium]